MSSIELCLKTEMGRGHKHRVAFYLIDIALGFKTSLRKSFQSVNSAVSISCLYVVLALTCRFSGKSV
jgi:hypothetical protein